MREFLKLAHQRALAEQSVWEPVGLAPSELEQLAISHPELKLIDHIDGLTEELFRLAHPSLPPTSSSYISDLEKFCQQRANQPDTTRWVYYPWLNTLVHLLSTEEHIFLRSARNRDLITDDEQVKLAASRVGVAGMSVGSSAVTALALSNCYAALRLADADHIELSNLNRIKGGVHHLGLPKVTLAARGVCELDPHAKVEVFDQGLTEDNLERFVDGLDIVVDEMDDLALKTRLRQLAKQKRLPVVMVTDDGDDCLLDVERYDLDPTLPIFHGLLDKSQIQQIEQGNLTKPQWLALSLNIIGVEYFPARLAESAPAIGRTLAGVPQMGGPSMVAGAIAAYAVRMILTGQALKSGKIPLPVEESMLADYHDPDVTKKRQALRSGLKARLNA